MVGYSYVMAFD